MSTQNPMSLGLDYARNLAQVGNQVEQRNASRQNQQIQQQQQERNQVLQGQQDQAGAYAQAQKQASGLVQLSQGLMQLPIEQRMQAIQEQAPMLESLDIDIAGLTPEAITDEGLTRIISTLGGPQKEPEAVSNPSSVREYEYYNNLPDDQKQQYLNVKRANQLYKEGDVTLQVDPVAGGSKVVTEQGVEPVAQADVQAKLSEAAAVKAAKTTAATQAIKLSGEAFTRLGVIRQAIPNLDEAMALVDQGANTGPIISKLPSVQQASLELDNLQGRLGLDVIGDTTFGALSESELKFALNTALPRGLKGPALKEWLQRKKDSQTKLAEYLEDAAIHLGTPGNTIAGFLSERKSNAEAADLTTMSDDDLMNF